MKALNVAVHATPVGLVAVLPEACDCDDGIIHTYRSTGPWVDVRCPDCARPGDVLGVVTKCERCDGHDFLIYACEGYAPLRFVKVLAVLPVVGDGDALVRNYDAGCILVTKHRDTGERLVLFVKLGAEPGVVVLDLPDAEPGGVALHVVWTDCPDCGGKGVRLDHDTVGRAFAAVLDRGRGSGAPILRCRCQDPFVPPSDAPIVEVK